MVTLFVRGGFGVIMDEQVIKCLQLFVFSEKTSLDDVEQAYQRTFNSQIQYLPLTVTYISLY
jgi:hypothetical protein